MQTKQASLRKRARRGVRRALNFLPRQMRSDLYRAMVDCDPAPDPRLQFKVAETQQELEDCFRILHDAYVAGGLMAPTPSGLRVTMYHALPTTTTLCAKYDGRVVGTLSVIREGVFGFPLQTAFDLSDVRAKQGQIAEISGLAVHPDFGGADDALLLPLMKFAYQYCTDSDTRHLVIAVHPEKIGFYESLLLFERLQDQAVSFDFVNGAPAVGATLDLPAAREAFRRVYARSRDRKNLYKYFVQLRLPNIQLPKRRYFTTNDPVLTPDALDYFFNQKSQVFAELDERRRALLWSIYDLPEFRATLPALTAAVDVNHAMRRHQRFSLRCPAELRVRNDGDERAIVMTVIEASQFGFQALSKLPIHVGAQGAVRVELGHAEVSDFEAVAVRHHRGEAGDFYGFRIVQPDASWRGCVEALETGYVARAL